MTEHYYEPEHTEPEPTTVLDFTDRLSEEPVVSTGRGARYKVHRATASGAILYTVTEDGVPIEDYADVDKATAHAERLERQRRQLRAQQSARRQGVTA